VTGASGETNGTCRDNPSGCVAAAPRRETMHVMAWGRQLAVAMTPGDEELFLAFLRDRCDLAILRTPSRSREAIWLEDFSPWGQGPHVFYLWNRSFPWEPAPAPTRDGASWYLPGLGQAPVLEYLRDPLRHGPGHHGRVYWARTPSPDGAFEAGGVRYAYDVAEFERWFGAVLRWLRKTGIRMNGVTPVVHCLPEAARHYGVR
jgi:hypothetical protein